MLSVIIPTLNAAASLAATVSGIAGREVVVSDGGSTDDTADAARALGATVVLGAAGRGAQLARGAAAATGAWLLFLHADTRLEAGWEAATEAFMADPANAHRAAYFRLRLDSPVAAARRVERLADWRARVLGLPYGDQGLLIARRHYDALGGYRPLPLMEDVDLVRRIGRGALVCLPCAAITSAARYERDGWWRRPARNLLCLSLYFLGVPPAAIRRLYG